MKTRLQEGEEIVKEVRGMRVGAKSIKEWFFKAPALIEGVWYITNRRLIFEGKKPSIANIGLSALLIKQPEPSVFCLTDLINLEILPWAKVESVLKVTFKTGTISIRLYWQTRAKLESLAQDIKDAKEKLT